MEESIILAVEIDTKKALTQIDLLAQAVDEAKKNQEELNKQFREGKISTDEYNKVTKENTKAIKSAETATKGLTSAVQAEKGSINDLRAQNRELEKQRNSLGVLTDSNKDKIDKLNAQININNQLIQQNVSGLEKQRLNIGNYASALDSINPQLGSFISGLEGSSRAGMQLIATPIGATLATIGVALLALTNYFKTTGEGEDQLAEKTASLNAIWKSFSNVLNDSVAFILNAEGGFDKLEKRIGIFSYTVAAGLLPLKGLVFLIEKLGDALGGEEGKSLAKGFDELSDASGLLALKEKQVRNEIELLILKSKDRQFTEKERAAFLEEATNKEIALTKELNALKLQQLDLTIKEIGINNQRAIDAIDLSNKTFENIQEKNEYIAKELLAGNSIIDSEREKILKALGEIEEVRGRSIENQQKIQNKQIILEEKAADKAQKNLDKEKKSAEERLKFLDRLALAEFKFQQDLEAINLEAQKINEDGLEKTYQTQLEYLGKELDAEILFNDSLTRSTLDEETKRSIMLLDIDYQTKLQLLKQEEEYNRQRVNNNEKSQKQIEASELAAKEAIKRAAFDSFAFVTDTIGRANQKRIASYKRMFDEGKITEEKLNELSAQSSKRYKAFALAEIALNYGVGFITAFRIAQKQAVETPGGGFALPIFYATQLSALLASVSKARAIIDSTSFSGGSSSFSGGSGGVSGGRSGVTATQATTNPINERFSLANTNQGMTVVASWKEATEVRNRVQFKESLITV